MSRPNQTRNLIHVQKIGKPPSRADLMLITQYRIWGANVATRVSYILCFSTVYLTTYTWCTCFKQKVSRRANTTCISGEERRQWLNWQKIFDRQRKWDRLIIQFLLLDKFCFIYQYSSFLLSSANDAVWACGKFTFNSSPTSSATSLNFKIAAIWFCGVVNYLFT